MIQLDATASGAGWYVDPTPAEDSEFAVSIGGTEHSAGPDSPAAGRIDLLTVVMHEMGHVLGLDDLDVQATPHDLMTVSLAPGIRRLPLPFTGPERRGGPGPALAPASLS